MLDSRSKNLFSICSCSFRTLESLFMGVMEVCVIKFGSIFVHFLMMVGLFLSLGLRSGAKLIEMMGHTSKTILGFHW